MKSRLLLILSLSVISPLQGAQIRTMDEFKALEMSISEKDLTRITVKDDRIQNVFGVAGEYVLETDEDQGQIFIRPQQSRSLRPISLTLTTEGGRTQDLRLIPKEQAAEALILKPMNDIQKEIIEEKKAQISRGEVEALLEGCKRGQIPQGYKAADLSLSTLQGPYKLLHELKGEKLRCLTFEVQNHAKPLSQDTSKKGPSRGMRLSEEGLSLKLPLQRQEIIAMLLPKHQLYPGERTSFYVVARTN